MKGEAYVKDGLTYLVNLFFCLTLVNQSYFFPFDDLFFHIQTGNNKILHVSFFFSFFFLLRLMFPQSSFKFHPFRF